MALLRNRNLILFFILPAAIFLAACQFCLIYSKKPLPDYGAFPDFKLVDQTGKAWTPSDLQQTPWIASFIFTRCQGQCPIISSQMQQLGRTLGTARLVSFSVDPEFDKPEVLKVYAERFEADPKLWTFLTGEREGVERVTRGLKMNGIDDPAFHSASLVLVDSKDRVRGYYDANDAERVKDLKQDWRRLGRRRFLLF